ncbi:dihydropteroate synthase [Stackebrandtia albiflava]|uniref:Dihydropteroate synthase n=1 Tax=Stackebrandtia albiflava TaxID=406432 RepID=A0A562UYJ6_9ACTN|nr:dihydropteroate synthase [Stackebrandtia albiflava]
MGILNVTPDSFSDGGRYLDVSAAVAHGLRLRDDGADIVDVGGESTRPGAQRVDADTEAARVGDVVAALAADGVPVSVDTTRASVARVALDRGAVLVNDVSGGLADPGMLPLAAESGCRIVLMHWRAHSATMQHHAEYGDVVAEVSAELSGRVAAARDAGVADDRIVLDPGLGFSKLPAHNWELSARLPELRDLGFPILFGASRKSYLGALLAEGDAPRPPDARDAATLATSVLAFDAGAWAVRVHDVRGTADARAVWQATRRAG